MPNKKVSKIERFIPGQYSQIKKVGTKNDWLQFSRGLGIIF